jgi:hypothetical protein
MGNGGKGGLKSLANDNLRGNLAILAPHQIPRMRATPENEADEVLG